MRYDLVNVDGEKHKKVTGTDETCDRCSLDRHNVKAGHVVCGGFVPPCKSDVIYVLVKE